MADKEQLAATIKALLWSVRVRLQLKHTSHRTSQIHELETTVCDYDANQDVLQTRVYVDTRHWRR